MIWFLDFSQPRQLKLWQATTALMNGLIFASYRFFMRVQLNNPNSIPTIAQIALAGAGSGIVSLYVTSFNHHLERNITQKSWLCRIVTTPTDLIKIRQQSFNAHMNNHFENCTPDRSGERRSWSISWIAGNHLKRRWLRGVLCSCM